MILLLQYVYKFHIRFYSFVADHEYSKRCQMCNLLFCGARNGVFLLSVNCCDCYCENFGFTLFYCDTYIKEYLVSNQLTHLRAQTYMNTASSHCRNKIYREKKSERNCQFQVINICLAMFHLWVESFCAANDKSMHF